jgi:hypothetical protein
MNKLPYVTWESKACAPTEDWIGSDLTDEEIAKVYNLELFQVVANRRSLQLSTFSSFRNGFTQRYQSAEAGKCK